VAMLGAAVTAVARFLAWGVRYAQGKAPRAKGWRGKMVWMSTPKGPNSLWQKMADTGGGEPQAMVPDPGYAEYWSERCLKAEQELKAAGIEERIRRELADAGYWSENNMVNSSLTTPEFLIATTKDWKQRKAMRERGAPRGRIPEQLSVRDRMERKLLTKGGSTLYKLRSQMVEPVFGQIKAVRDCGTFMRRGLKAAQSEWRLICATHNLLKLFRNSHAISSPPHALYTSISPAGAG